MLHPPVASSPTLFHPLDVGAIAVELLASARTAADGKASRTLIKSDASTVVVIALRRGTRMVEHHAPSTVVIVPLVGQVTFTSSTADASAPVTGSQCLVMGPRARHDVLAVEDAAFMLIIGGTAGADAR
jgi:quercetin dioxygenase-like cupin family protein